MGRKLEYLINTLEYITLENATLKQIEGCIKYLDPSYRRSMILTLSHKMIILISTSDYKRLRLTYSNIYINEEDGIEEIDPEDSILLDPTQNPDEELEIRYDNGEISYINKNNTISRDVALHVVMHFLRHNQWPDGLEWG